MEKIMHHYTNENEGKGIVESKLMNPSLRANNPKDARFAGGQYISDIVLGTKKLSQFSQIFFGLPWARHRFTHQISLDVSGLDVIFSRTNVYLILHSEPLDISDVLLGYGSH